MSIEDDDGIKSALVEVIKAGVKNRADGNQSEAARRIGLAQPDLSRILNGSVGGFSVWRLMRVLASLGYDVTVAFSESHDGKGAVRIVPPGT